MIEQQHEAKESLAFTLVETGKILVFVNEDITGIIGSEDRL